MDQALLIVGHGSRDPEGVGELLDMVRGFRESQPGSRIEVAFLEFTRPTIGEMIDRLAAEGCGGVVVLPGVLLAAGHAKNDIAGEVRAARVRHPGLPIHMGRPLDIDPSVLQLCRVRYQEALAGRPAVAPGDTQLLLIGRGSSDPDANANVAKVARFLQEGYPTGWASVAYTGVASPAIPDALRVCERMGFRRVVVQPYFLFTGVLVKRIYAQVEEARQRRPDIEFVTTSHLRAHELLFEAFAGRAREAADGTAHMNCSLCQYRVSIIGHENRQGEPQLPHHHHVEGVLGHVGGAPSAVPLAFSESRAVRPAEPGSGDSHLWTNDLRSLLRF